MPIASDGAQRSAMPFVPCDQATTGQPPFGAVPRRDDDVAGDAHGLALVRLRDVHHAPHRAVEPGDGDLR